MLRYAYICAPSSLNLLSHVKHRLLILCILCLLCLGLTGCRQKDDHVPTVSFYYWRTTFALTEEEGAALRQNGVNHIYIRYFDVALQNGEPFPLSPISFSTPPPDTIAITPVVYLKNEVLLTPGLNVADLAEKVVSYIEQINTRHHMASHEIQIDCDWTLKSMDTYFKFLTLVKTHSGTALSATIRLHQVKFRERTGIPPVDRGVLMYYNMGRIAADASNAIYERAIATQYTERLGAYPLPLQVALPIFSWGIHIRNHTAIGLLNKTDATLFEQDTAHYRQLSPNLFDVTKNVIIMHRYLEKGDQIKIEAVDADDLLGMANDLHDVLAQPPHEIIFYDLDDFNLTRYQDANALFKKICHRF